MHLEGIAIILATDGFGMVRSAYSSGKPALGVGPPLSREKLSPVLACYKATTTDEGIQRAEEMIDFRGAGHSSVIYLTDQNIIDKFPLRMNIGRIIVNSPSSQGAIGDIYNAQMPPLTLGLAHMVETLFLPYVGTVHLINFR